MEQSTVTLVLGIAGIASTLTVSAMSLFYTAKSRAAPLRQALFAKQLEMAIEIIHLQSRIRNFVTILSCRDGPHRAEARHDIGEHYRQFAEAEEKAGLVFPVELWVEVKGLSSELSKAIDEVDSQGIIEQTRMKTLVARMTKIALLSRVVIGSDELTEQSIGLFSSQKEYLRVANLGVTHFEKIHSEVNNMRSPDAT